MAENFRTWRKVAEMLETGKMPPEDADQPTPAQRRQLAAAIRRELLHTAQQHANDPGAVTIRRLTSAEYAYTIHDLTRLDLDLERGFISDAVGGAGFANIGDVQFLQDSTIELYLAAAKQVAAHAVIGTGPLQFFRDPGATGLELSAITRIQAIYRAHGFRTAAGEGGEAFGLDRYARAFFAAWQYQHRDKLGIADKTLADLAMDEDIDARFAEYIWSVMTRPSHSFPTADVVARWQALPKPSGPDAELASRVRGLCDEIYQLIYDWQTRLGQNPDAKEEAPVLAEDAFHVVQSKRFEMGINWPEGTTAAHLRLTVESASGDGQPAAIVVWRKPMIQFRMPDRRLRPPRPLKEIVSAEDAKHLRFGEHPAGESLAETEFATQGAAASTFVLPIPDRARSALLTVRAELDVENGDDAVVRCTIAQEEETDQGKQVSALLANPGSAAFQKWKAGVLDFARLLPQVSHREPAPLDRDPIPAPFDNSYNNPERNLYHYQIKYHRDDRFLVENILDDATRRELDIAWNDLLGSFEYHDAYLRFVANKFGIDLGGRGISDFDAAAIAALPAEPRHVEDVLRFANRAWRRPLSQREQDQLRGYYTRLRADEKLDHAHAIRALLTRVLPAPAFLFRAESTASGKAIAPLTDWELASRLSYLLWSSLPDDELNRAAAAGELSDPKNVAEQTRRMLRDPKARRLATEFFGQWFGFYRFDRHRGVDPKRFPEFTDKLKAAMYDEAISFFEYLLREDRPVREILFADYVFLNNELAAHYGIENAAASSTVRRVDGVSPDHRGGLFGLGAVLTATSAPRRTSPVKRGDWVLRRVLGTPVPPPPADAGSIPADDVLADGLT